MKPTDTNDGLPVVTTPKALAKHLGWSERRVRELARKIGACRIMGNRMVLLQADVEEILEATKPRPSRPTVMARSTAARAPQGDYATLQAMKAKQALAALSQKAKAKSDAVKGRRRP